MQLGKHFVDLTRDKPDERLLKVEDMAEYQRLVVIPWREQDGKVWLVTSWPGVDVDEFGARRYGAGFEVAVTSKFDILWMLQKHFGAEMSRAALSSLADAAPQYSARVVVTPRQVVGMGVLVTLLALALYVAPTPTIIAVNIVVAMFYLDRKSTRLNSSHVEISYAVFCLKK